MVLVFGFINVEHIEAQTDNRLNGTWVDNDGDEIRYNNSIFEQTMDGPFLKGTYTTSGNNTIMYKFTHFHSAAFGMISPIPPGWNTVSDTISLLRRSKDSSKYSSIIKFLESGGSTEKYIIKGDIITFTDKDGDVSTFTKEVIISENELLGIWVSESGVYSIEFKKSNECTWYQSSYFFNGTYEKTTNGYQLKIMGGGMAANTVFNAITRGNALIITGGIVYGERFTKKK